MSITESNTNLQENITLITEFLREKRREKGLPQRKVAKLIGCNQSQFSKKERGDAPYTLTELLILCELYDLNTEYLFWKMSSYVSERNL